MFNLLKDVRSGALPPEEIPGFAAWVVRKMFWVLFALICGGAIGLLLR